MATTARGIVYPTVGTTLTPLSNHFAALASSADTAIGAIPLNSLTGLYSAIPAAGQEGRTYYATDTNRTWFDNGSNWISADAGTYLVRPTAVSGSGVSISATGSVIFTAVPASTTVKIEGVFSSRFRNYSARGIWSAKPSGSPVVQGLVGSTPSGGTSYSVARSGFVGGARSDAQLITQSSFLEGFLPTVGASGGGSAEILNPNRAEATFIIGQTTVVGGTTGISHISAVLNSTDQLTGLQITTWPGGTSTGELTFYGMVN